MPPPLVGNVNSMKAGPVNEPLRRIRADHFARIRLACRLFSEDGEFFAESDLEAIVERFVLFIIGSLPWARRRAVSGRR